MLHNRLSSSHYFLLNLLQINVNIFCFGLIPIHVFHLILDHILGVFHLVSLSLKLCHDSGKLSGINLTIGLFHQSIHLDNHLLNHLIIIKRLNEEFMLRQLIIQISIIASHLLQVHNLLSQSLLSRQRLVLLYAHLKLLVSHLSLHINPYLLSVVFLYLVLQLFFYLLLDFFRGRWRSLWSIIVVAHYKAIIKRV